ncbi:MAG TPA: class I SAM-dependent methyltransferase, partial [Candidatus Limnocylindria bacterium]|nr:class I SAM-dependent methyltransferase [Candidatus Limnocylindria bacterium]
MSGGVARDPEADREARLRWDERHRSGDFEGRGPNPTLIAAVDGLQPGRALELGAGSGTNAVWLAS